MKGRNNLKKRRRKNLIHKRQASMIAKKVRKGRCPDSEKVLFKAVTVVMAVTLVVWFVWHSLSMQRNSNTVGAFENKHLKIVILNSK